LQWVRVFVAFVGNGYGFTTATPKIEISNGAERETMSASVYIYTVASGVYYQRIAKSGVAVV
jgi:hypothetical protein